MPGKKTKEIFYHYSKWLARLILRVLYGCKFEGRENIPQGCPLIIASNHCSYCDPMSVGAGVPRPIHFMAKTDLFKNPFFGGFIRFYHAVPIRRGGMDWRGIEVLKKILSDNGALIMFPQGTRRPDGGSLGKPKFGVGMFAQETGATIVPVFMLGTGRLTEAFLRRRPMRVYFGEPIRPEDYAHIKEGPRGQLQIAEMVMERIAELIKSNHPDEYMPDSLLEKESKKA
jgi:1-acyl-sn-glycerol-3-phosphate acyltransferase